MVNQKIIEYLKTSLSKGVSLDKAKASLMQKGWQENDINEAVQAVSPPVNSSPVVGYSSDLNNSSNKKLWVIGGFVFGFLILGIFGLFLIMGDSDEDLNVNNSEIEDVDAVYEPLEQNFSNQTNPLIDDVSSVLSNTGSCETNQDCVLLYFSSGEIISVSNDVYEEYKISYENLTGAVSVSENFFNETYAPMCFGGVCGFKLE